MTGLISQMEENKLDSKAGKKRFAALEIEIPESPSVVKGVDAIESSGVERR